MDKKVVLITGGNAGIGFAICQRLLRTYENNIHLCMCCRNKNAAEISRKRLLDEFENAEISIVIVDVSKLSSIYKSAVEIRSRFSHIDYIYFNAGIMPVSSVDWTNFWHGVVSMNWSMFHTGDGLLKQVNRTTEEGFKEVFATNVFGHFILLRQLKGHIGGLSRPTKIIWTSSSNAKKSAFDIEDIQHSRGSEPYSSSKYQIDMLSVALSEKLESEGVHSYTTCPGLVMTNLTYNILPKWFWVLIIPIIWLLRLFVPSMNYDPENGAEAAVWLFSQSPESLNPKHKFHSCTSFFGKTYVDCIKMDMNAALPLQTYNALCSLENELPPHIRNFK